MAEKPPRRDPVEFSNLERFLWTPGEDGRNRALQFYQRMFDVCVRSKSLEPIESLDTCVTPHPG